MNVEIHKLLQKGAISIVSNPQTQGFLSRIFLVPKKDGSPQATKPLCYLGAFQVGKYPSSGEFNPGGRLDDKDGSQGCLFLHPNPSGTSSVAMVPVAGADVRISVPAFRSVLSRE